MAKTAVKQKPPDVQKSPEPVKQPVPAPETRKIRRFSGKEVASKPFRVCAKLEGEPGKGKTLFYLSEAWRARANKIAPSNTLIYIIDFVGTGITDILQREAIFPKEYLESVQYVNAQTYDEGDEALTDFDSLARNLTNGFVVLVIEGDHRLFDKCRDKYCLSSRGKMYDAVVQEACNKQVMYDKQGKSVFEESIRDAYTVINPLYEKFMEKAFLITQRHVCNFYLTAHLSYKWAGFNAPKRLEVLGKPDKIDGFFDYILRFFTKEEIRDANGKIEKVTRYLIDSQKCRRVKNVIVPNNGAWEFWKRIEEERKKETYQTVFSNVVREGDRLETEK